MVANAVKQPAVRQTDDWHALPISPITEPRLFWLLVRLEAEYDEAAEQAAIDAIISQKYAPKMEGVTCQS